MGRLSDAFFQYVSDAQLGGSLNPEWTPEAKTKLASTMMDLTPVIGSVKGAKEEWQAGNKGLAAFNAVMAPVDAATLGGGTFAKAALVKMLGAGTGLSPMIIGALKPGKYPSHGWNIKGNDLKSAVENMSDIVPHGIPESHQDGVSELISAIRDRGLLPFTDVDKGGSVYVSAMKPKINSSGSMNMKSMPEKFGSPGYYGGVTPYQVRFSDHGQFYSGPTMSIDPHSGNTTETAIQFLDSLLGKGNRPKVGSSYIIPSTGEQGSGLLK